MHPMYLDSHFTTALQDVDDGEEGGEGQDKKGGGEGRGDAACETARPLLLPPVLRPCLALGPQQAGSLVSSGRTGWLP